LRKDRVPRVKGVLQSKIQNDNVKFKIDGFVKSMKIRFSVNPADPGSGPGQEPESSIFEWL